MKPAAAEAAEAMSIAKCVAHLRNPQNLLTYLAFTAWCKFMGVAQYLPTVSIG